LHHQLDLEFVQQLIAKWLAKLEGVEHPSLLLAHGPPVLVLGKRTVPSVSAH
jgi:hypothetical protein